MARVWLLYTVLIIYSSDFASSQAPSADAECTNSLLSLINCEPFLTGTVTIPTDTCCQGLGALVKTAPLCLCGVLAGNPAFSSVNLTRALQLPSECDIPIDEGQCAEIGAPPPKTSSSPDTPSTISPPARTGTGSSSSLRHLPSLACLVVGVLVSATVFLSA